MKILSQRLSFLIVMIFLFSELTSYSASRKLPTMTATEEFQRSSFDGKRMLSKVSAAEKYDRIYGVSARLVPHGPNPLHNK
ncbi:PREDICTED: CLAVATA3/ESR (CLE)-related protein 2-like [Camelina sativa]|uniref:CLAVATA3/ESR (CLE)-related protein 2-like n=1 Tax=Camelina sativa TaxID=90675 RepID=A0ABM1QG60_CAMSA|nr:PREDICTED: CLAVATA3/ESR (CLE)-related protein 2-like [Camelina sativa]